MDESDCKNVVKAFRDAAERAEKAGFDAVEIHAAHGYLLSEFLSPLTNHRTDACGGSTENRCRLLIEVLKAVHEVWPQEKPVLLRVSAEDYEPDGMHPDEMAKNSAIRNLRSRLKPHRAVTKYILPSKIMELAFRNQVSTKYGNVFTKAISPAEKTKKEPDSGFRS